MGFGSETTNKGTTTSLAPSLSKDETLQLFFNNKSIQKKLQDLLQDDDRITFHSELKLDRIFKISMMVCLAMFVFSLLAGFCFLFISLLVADDSFNGISLFAMSLLYVVASVATLLLLPFRSSVILTRNSLIVINSMIVLPNRVKMFSDFSKISKIVGSIKVKVAPDQPEVTAENIKSLVCEESILKKDGVFEVTLGPQSARFTVDGAEDLIEAFENIYDTSPTLTVISERREYLKATLLLVVCFVFFFGSSLGILWLSDYYQPLPIVILCGCVVSLLIVYFLCFSLFQDRKYQVDHTFNLSS